ncbi:unnamed protein product [Gemmataceae bacterium]|nr:unnamed protein product [Gemmataceae bacterium]VTT98042.1 unnamed protein product [Gemmataceae bacterium]
MARRPRNAMPGPPPATGGYEFEVIELGPPVYFTPPPEVKVRGSLIPMGDGEGLPYRPAPRTNPRRARLNVPLVVAPDEVAALPKLAREAFVARCAERVPPGSVEPTPQVAAAVAHYLFAAATTDTPLTAQLRCVRRDFNRLRTLARKGNWTDDTPVPPGAFGPLWPEGVAPHWAAEPQKG